MIRLISISIILLNTIILSAQSDLYGRYSKPLKDEFGKFTCTEWLIFGDSSRFSYNISCPIIEYGEGTFLVEEDSLHLHFYNYPSDPFNSLSVLDSSLTEKDSITIQLKIVQDSIKKPSTHSTEVGIYILNDTGAVNYIFGTLIHIDSLTIKIPKQNKSIHLHIRHFDANNKVFVLNGIYNYNTICTLYGRNWGRIENTTYSYKIIERSKRKLHLRSTFDNEEEVQEFKKIDNGF